MRHHLIPSISAIAIAAGIGSMQVATSAAQSATSPSHPGSAQKSSAKWTPPRTAWGDPDLQGTYTSDNSIGVPFERPPQFAGRATLNDEEYAARERANAEQIAKDAGEFPETPFGQDAAANNAPRHWLDRPTKPSRASSHVVEPADGRIPPMTPEAQRLSAQQRAIRLAHEQDSYEYHTNYDRCITRGVTGSILPVIYGNGTNILQGPGYVVIRNEMIHEARLIPLDPRPRLGKSILQYMGDPSGDWEGDTLVVESTNFTDNTGLGGNGNGAIHSENLRLTERFTRTGPGTIHYEFSVDDPTMYSRPWKVALDLTAKPEYRTIYEYACHEGNYGLANMLSAARADERAAGASK